MHSLKILIVEDNLTIAMEIESCLQDLGYLVCGVARNDNKALEFVKTHQPDLIIMDIELEKGSVDGIELTKQIKQQKDIPIIYLTSHFNNAVIRKRAFSTNPQNFLLKPEDINNTKLSIAIELAIKNHCSAEEEDTNEALLVENASNSSFYLKQNKRLLKIKFDDIVYLEAHGESVFIYTDEIRLIFTIGLGKTLAKLNRSNILRIQKSYAINADKIHSYISSDKERKIFVHYKNDLKELSFSDTFRDIIINYHPRLTTK